jgi:hypothetical protein
MSDFTNLTLSVRSSMPPDSLTEAIKQQVWTVDRGLPVYDVLRMQDILDDTVSQRRFSSVLLGVFGGLGILLACIGIYGALTFNVVQRTREIGIRMALGADRGGVLRMIMSEGLLLVGVGCSYRYRRRYSAYACASQLVIWHGTIRPCYVCIGRISGISRRSGYMLYSSSPCDEN